MFDLVIDARMQHHSGIGTYLRNVIPYLEKSNLRIAKIESGPAIYSIAEQIKLPLSIPRCKVFWSPHFNVPLLPIRAEKRLVTIHDFYHLVHYNQLSLLQKLYAKQMFTRAVNSTEQLIVASEFTKSELYHFFPQYTGNVEVIHHGPGQLLEQEAPMDTPEQFFLFVGNLKPHKNLELLLKAFKRANVKEHLVIAGKKEGFIRGIELQEEERVHLLGEVSGGQLATLYKRATALVFPSLYEGWGLPPMEAMQHGCPVLAAHCASIPEACGDAALYFLPHDSDALSLLLEQVSTQTNLRDELIEKGRRKAAEYSWEQSAKKHLDLISTILQEQNQACRM